MPAASAVMESIYVGRKGRAAHRAPPAQGGGGQKYTSRCKRNNCKSKKRRMISMTSKVKKVISLVVIAVVIVALIAGNVVAGIFAGLITNFSTRIRQISVVKRRSRRCSRATRSSALWLRTASYCSKTRRIADGEPAPALQRRRAQSQPLRLQRLRPLQRRVFRRLFDEGHRQRFFDDRREQGDHPAGRARKRTASNTTPSSRPSMTNLTSAAAAAKITPIGWTSPTSPPRSSTRRRSTPTSPSSCSAAWVAKTSASSRISRRRAPSTPTRPTSRSPIPNRRCSTR